MSKSVLKENGSTANELTCPVRGGGENAAACAVIGCTNDEGLRPVEHPDRGTRVLCRYHRKHYLGVSS